MSANDSALVLSAIEFIEVMIRPRPMDTEIVVEKLRRSVSISWVGVVNRLLKGCSGIYEHSVVGRAADLLFSLFRYCPSDQMMQEMSSVFQNQEQDQRIFFHLGDDAKQLVLNCLTRNCTVSDRGVSTWSRKDLNRFLEQIWDLHRNADDASNLPDSDAVARFMRKYAVP